MAGNYPPGVSGNEPQIVGYDEGASYLAAASADELPTATPETDGLTAGGLFLDMTASWHALTLAEWQGRPDSELLAHYDAYLTSLGAYVKYRREWAEREGQREAERKQRANWNAIADGMAPPHPSEY